MRHWAHISILLLIIFVELLLFSLVFDAYSKALVNSGRWFAFLAYSGNVGRFGIIFFTAMVLIMWPRLVSHLELNKGAVIAYRTKCILFLILHFCAFLVLFIFSAVIFSGQPVAIPNVVVLIWVIALLVTLAAWLLALAPWSYWKKFLNFEKSYLLYCVAASFLAFLAAKLSQSLWQPLSDIAFETSAFVLRLFYQDLFFERGSNLIGINDFVVHIARQCSGYEGIGLVTIFTALYLSVYRKEFRFPQAFLLFPIGVITIWALNIVRIVILIIIGGEYSPVIAVGGFHSQAGWMFFLLVTSGLLVIAHRSSFFSIKPEAENNRSDSHTALNLPSALILPFVILMASIIFTSAFSGDFVWLYPLRVVLVIAVLAFCWKSYDLSRLSFRFMPILAGVLVFLIWILLVPENPSTSLELSSALMSAPLWLSVTWVIFRFLGAVVTVPIAEEFMFRGYLLSRLAGKEIAIKGNVDFSWVALIGSSFLFGFLHQNFLGGFIAGFIYGLVRYRSHSILDAVVAHSVTNLLLSLLVLLTGSWSYW